MLIDIITIPIMVLIALSIFANIIRKKIKGSGGCSDCSGNCSCKSKNTVKVKDKNANNYPYKKVLKIGGMTSTECAKIIENNFNKLGNIYAKVNFDSEEAVILMKEELSDNILDNVIRDSGYRYYIKN